MALPPYLSSPSSDASSTSDPTFKTPPSPPPQAPNRTSLSNIYIPEHHLARTACKDASFLLPHIKPNHRRILDIGCGPGTITTGLCAHVPGGRVVGLDSSAATIAFAKLHLLDQSARPHNISFEVGDVRLGIEYPDAFFDVVFANQVVLRLEDPVQALREMKRLCRPGGFVAVLETDFPVRWYPYLEGLRLSDKYMYEEVAGQTDVQFPQAAPHKEGYRGGSMLHVWAREAGFEVKKMQNGGSAEVRASEKERRWWAEIGVRRLEEGGGRDKWMALGATAEELEIVKKDLWAWAEDVDGWYAQLQVELICWV